MESEAKLAELNNLLIALQLVSITLLQKKAMNEQSIAFFHKVTDTFFALQAVLDNPSVNNVNRFHDDVEKILDENNKQASDIKLDDKLVNLLKDYSMTRIQNTKIHKNLLPHDEIKQRIKSIESKEVYLSPPQTPQTQLFGSKVEEILQTLTSNQTDKKKNNYLKNTLVDLNSIINEIKTSVINPPTEVQIAELDMLQKEIQEIGHAYTRQVQIEQDEEVALQNEIKNLINSDNKNSKINAIKYINNLAHRHFKEEEYSQAEKYLQDAIEVASGLENETEKLELESKAFELLAQICMKQKSYEAAKANFQMAADLLNDQPNVANHLQKLNQHIHMAEEKIVEQIIKSDKDINELERIKNIFKTSGDVLLTAFTNKTINTLYEKLINPSIKPVIKVQLINKFTEDWQKYLNEKNHAASRAQWYTPEMTAMIDHGLLNTMRMIRETFSAQAAQQVSTEHFIEAKEKVLLEKREMEKAAAALQAKKDEQARQQALEEELRRKAQADEEAKLRIQAAVAAKIRNEELNAARTKITNLSKIQNERNLKQILEQFALIKPEERVNEDLAKLADTHSALGLVAKDKNEISIAHQQLLEAKKHYDLLLKKPGFRNSNIIKSKIETLAELGRLAYLDNNPAQAVIYFTDAIKEIRSIHGQTNIDVNFKAQLSELEKCIKAHCLLVKKLISEPVVMEPGEELNLLERLFHYKDLQKSVLKEEKKLLDQIVKADPKMQSKLPRVKRLHEILTRIEHAPLKKNIILSAINSTEIKEENSPLNIQDKAIIKSYHEAMVNYAFAETLKEISNNLPSDMLSYVEKLELIRSELRAGNEATFNRLGLSLEQKIAYLEYETQLLRKETEGLATQPTITRARVNLNSLLNNYRRELVNPSPAPGEIKRRRRWSMGNVVAGLRRRNKKVNNPISSSSRTK